MSSEIAKRTDVGLSAMGTFTPKNLTEAIEIAKLIAYSGMVPKGFEQNPGAVLVAIQMGAELGLSPMASLQNIAVINGRPSVWGDSLLAVILQHAECEDVIEDDIEEIHKSQKATCTVKRRGRTAVTRTFSVADAKTAGLWGKPGPWTQYPGRMLQMRARSFAIRDAFPDALRGIRVVEEEQDVTPVEVVQVDTSKKATDRLADKLLPSRSEITETVKHEENQPGHKLEDRSEMTEPVANVTNVANVKELKRETTGKQEGSQNSIRGKSKFPQREAKVPDDDMPPWDQYIQEEEDRIKSLGYNPKISKPEPGSDG